jgi:hypothetical protein
MACSMPLTDKASESMVGVFGDEDLADAMCDAQHWVFCTITFTLTQELITAKTPVLATVSQKLLPTPGEPEKDELMHVN